MRKYVIPIDENQRASYQQNERRFRLRKSSADAEALQALCMKLLYATNVRIPTEKANGLQIIKMCEAFRRQGTQVVLFVPFRFQSSAMKQVRNIWAHYDVETTFSIKRVFSPDFIILENKLPGTIVKYLGFFQYFIFALFALFRTIFEPEGIYYSRALQTIFLLCLTKWFHRKKIYFEAHELHGDPHRPGRLRRLNSAIMGWMLHHIDGVIVITHQLKSLYTEMGMEEQAILVAPDGIDAKRLSRSIDQDTARRRAQISLDKTIICYTGQLFQWKGVYTLAESVTYLPEDYLIYIVGGMEPDILSLQRFITEQHLKNIVITGYVPYPDVPIYLAASDVLVLPNTSKVRISRECTSPLKLFEYMGARRPIVASDLPSIREVLRHRENAYLVPPDEPKALAEGILTVLKNRKLSEKIQEAAYTEVQEYTWDKRAANIIKFLQIEEI